MLGDTVTSGVMTMQRINKHGHDVRVGQVGEGDRERHGGHDDYFESIPRNKFQKYKGDITYKE